MYCRALWLSLEPSEAYTQLLLSSSERGTLLRARLPPWPVHPEAMATLLEALSAWCGQPLCVVLDADAEVVRRNPGEWSRLLADVEEKYASVEWTAVSLETRGRRGRFFEGIPGQRRSARLLARGATGQR